MLLMSLMIAIYKFFPLSLNILWNAFEFKQLPIIFFKKNQYVFI